MNYRLTLQYDGTDFHGWQIQNSLRRTVQGELERTLARLDGNPVNVHGAGRTDAGVHAEAQVANVHLQREWTGERLRAAINGNLRCDLRVMEAQIVDDDFHARFSATGKTYRYRIFNAPFISPFLGRYALHEARPLNSNRMQQTAQLFLGEHDWTAFSSAHTHVRSRVRTVTQLDVAERWSAEARGRVIDVTASADGFLRYMVRSVVGTLLAVGRGELDDDRVAEAIRTGNHVLVGATAHARGLTLVKAHYPIADVRLRNAD